LGAAAPATVRREPLGFVADLDDDVLRAQLLQLARRFLDLPE
jgi:hypothetical protein